MMTRAMNRHLNELRARAIKCALVYLAIFGVCFYYSSELYSALARIIATPLIATQVTATFMVPLRLCMFCALLIAMPYILYHVWQFIRPGLHQIERQNIAPWIIASCALFYTGIAFAMLIIAPMALQFFHKCAPDNVTMMVDIGNYLDFMTTLALAGAMAFQVPIVTIFLLKTGIVSLDQIKIIRPYVIVAAFILGMLLTPPDVISTALLGLPMWALFEAGVLLYTLGPRAHGQTSRF